jgi:betaine-aldehyde dehydrogenase
MHIAGRSAESSDQETFPIIDPSTEDQIGEMPCGTGADIDRAVLAARRAAPPWAEASSQARANALLAISDLIETHAPELAHNEVRDAGKPITAINAYELPAWIETFRSWAAAARTVGALSSPGFTNQRVSLLRRESVGVVAQIGSWHAPLLAACRGVATALAAGNTVVLMPSELTPVNAVRLAELASDVLPPGVVNVVTGASRTTGEILVRHPGVDLVAFTGPQTGGEWLSELAPGGGKRLCVALAGGNSPVVVFDDVDLEVAVPEIARSGFYNAGQHPLAATQVLVAAGLYDDFVSSLAEEARRYPLGDTSDPGTRLGPLISQAHRARVSDLLTMRSPGAEIVAGGDQPPRPGYYLDPTVVAGVSQTDGIVKHEVFGPVITVQRFTDEAGAVSWANAATARGGASVWTGDISRALRVAAALRFGSVSINEQETPGRDGGGLNLSGSGTEAAIASIYDQTEIKHVMASLNVESEHR